VTSAPLGRAGTETALDAVVKRLEDLIVDELDPGMQMPSEGSLALDCGVSRLTIREALKVLAGRGLVELSRGRRPTVREPDSGVLSGYLSIAIRRDPRALLELTEIRQALEVLSVSLAARNASRGAIAAVDSAFEEMASAAATESTDGAEAYHEADVAFHEALALASGNRMLAFLLEGLEDSLRRSFRQSYEGHRALGGSTADVLDAHREIADRVRQGDARGAAQAMRAHLKGAERDLRASLRGVEPTRTGDPAARNPQ
jgi:GntR family transcriptional repressor for pyruvate dehydrogenase complex